MKLWRQLNRIQGIFVVAAGLTASILVAGILPGVAQAENFVLRLEGRTPVAGMLCDDFAFAEGQRLKEFVGDSMNGFQVLDSRCRLDDSYGSSTATRWNIDISYSASEQLPMIATDSGYDIYPVGYLKKSDCESVRSVEVERFKRLTQLSVFAAVCKVPMFVPGLFTLSIVGFGDPAVKPFTSSFNVYSAILGHTRGTFRNMVATRMAADQFEVAELTYASHMAYDVFSLSYYGTEPTSMTDTTIGIFDKPDRCLLEVAGIERALTEAEVTQYAVFCGKPALPGTGSHELTAIVKGSRSVSLITPETDYPTYDACNLQKAALTDHYRQQLNRDIRGAFCTVKKNAHLFNIVMIEKR